jgi:DNA adenine methylase
MSSIAVQDLSAASPERSVDALVAVRPFLKWAGGKRQLLPHLRRFVPSPFDRYFEPFLGSAAFFLDLCRRGEIGSRTAVLADNNRDLIGCYRAVEQDVDKVIRELRKLAAHHAADGAAHYYRIRDDYFNPLRHVVLRRSNTELLEYSPKLAAMFIYLNRTGFNGLYRLNARGDFNVPAGRYMNPRICDAQNLRAVATTLQSRVAELRHGSFETVVADCRKGDFLYFDPPYAPLSSTSSFTSYTASGFAEADQRRLQQIVVQLAEKHCYVLLSNSTAPIIRELYDVNREARRAGLRTFRVPARRAINSKKSGRGEITEYIVTNIRPS